MAFMMNGMVTKGPMPTISIILRAVASFSPKPRTRVDLVLGRFIF